MYHHMTSVHEDLRGEYRPQALQLVREHNVRIWTWQEQQGAAFRRIPKGQRLDRGAEIREPWITCPQDMDALGFAILAHEVGHHACGHTLQQYRALRTWAKETEAWDFALAQMRRLDVPYSEEVDDFRVGALREIYYHALKSGLRVVPPVFIDALDPEELDEVLMTLNLAPREELPNAIRQHIYEILRDSDY
jgi:hypothetical protein